ncbi:MAG: hypothetical protein KBS83_03845, partial [Lachnospiraceae bacterium]|nr:hypothetical protein [Candidatus Equihabitans merdae]
MAKKIMMMFLGITMLASLTACAAKGASGQDTAVSAAAEAEVAEEADLVESEEESAEEEQVDMPEDPTINPDNAQFWREALQKYRDDDNVHQV